MIFHIFSQSIAKTESIFSTTTSPSSFRKSDFYTLYFWEIFSFPEFLSSWDDVFRKFSFHFLYFFWTIGFLSYFSFLFHLFLTFFYPVLFFSEKFFDEKLRIEEGRSHKKLSSRQNLESKGFSFGSDECIWRCVSHIIRFPESVSCPFCTLLHLVGQRG